MGTSKYRALSMGAKKVPPYPYFLDRRDCWYILSLFLWYLVLGNYILSYDIVKYWSIISLGFVPKLELVILLSELIFLVLYSLFAIKVYEQTAVRYKSYIVWSWPNIAY